MRPFEEVSQLWQQELMLQRPLSCRSPAPLSRHKMMPLPYSLSFPSFSLSLNTASYNNQIRIWSKNTLMIFLLNEREDTSLNEQSSGILSGHPICSGQQAIQTCQAFQSIRGPDFARAEDKIGPRQKRVLGLPSQAVGTASMGAGIAQALCTVRVYGGQESGSRDRRA